MEYVQKKFQCRQHYNLFLIRYQMHLDTVDPGALKQNISSEHTRRKVS